jgi:membrane-associated phospholipid phosphatase
VIWAHVPIQNFDSLFTHGVKFANNVAAVPSLHAAYALLVTLYLWRISPAWTRPLLVLYPPAMAFALVYAGEHYVVDCIAGWAYAAAVFVAVDRWFGRVTAEEREPRPLLAEPVPLD